MVAIRLNLGSCGRNFAGFISVDTAPPADVIADLSKAWPWETGSVDAVKAFQVAEHIADSIHFMNELWRVCRAGAPVEMEVPSASHGSGAFHDPTHKSFWTMNSFQYFEEGSPHRVRFGAAYGITAKFRILELRERKGVGNRYEDAWIICARLQAVK